VNLTQTVLSWLRKMGTRNGYEHEYHLAEDGVDLHHDLINLSSLRSPKMNNCYFRDGIISRLGMTKLSATEVDAGKSVSALHRFYFSESSKQLLVASGTTLKKYDDISAYDDVATGLTDGAELTMHTWGPKDAVYVSNGNETPFKWDGATKTNLSIFPSTTKQFIAILDRLAWIDGTNPTFIQVSKAFDDTAVESVQNAMKVPGPSIIYGLAYHGLITDVGFAYKILIAKGTSIWMLTANDLTPASLDVRLDIVSENIGCEAWQTMKSTPVGTFFLGTDKQVYLITMSMQIVIVGSLIRSNRVDLEGIEQIPTGQMGKPFAVYHDGFYKLFFPATGGTHNSLQYWLDISRFKIGRDGFWGPWYGPMKGQSIAHAIVQNGPGDNGKLFGGEGNAVTGSLIYQLDSGNSDNGNAIDYLYQTNFSAHQRKKHTKIVNTIDIEMASVDGTLNVSFFDTTGTQSSGEQIALISDSVFWGEKTWDDFFWTAAGVPVRQEIVPGNKLIIRYLSIVFQFSSTTEQFKLYRVMCKGQIRSIKPFVGSIARE